MISEGVKSSGKTKVKHDVRPAYSSQVGTNPAQVAMSKVPMIE